MIINFFPNDGCAIDYSMSRITLVNVNTLVVATTSWWLHFTAPVVAEKVKKSIPVDFIIYL